MMERSVYHKWSAVFAALIMCAALAGCGEAEDSPASGNVVYIYNWGDYMDPDVPDMFTEETGIKVVLDEFDTNETMYPKIAAGAVHYDLVCPSDYMISKMLENDLLQPLDKSLLPNAVKYIGEKYMEQASSIDPGNRYAIPYTWGTVGIMYNKNVVKEPVDSWSILWDPKYDDEIVMQDSVRDTFMVAEKLLGYSCNTVDEEELMACRDLLIAQKPIVQAYGIDDVRDKLVSGEAGMGVIFSGEGLWMQQANPDLDFAVPKEGTNFFIDAWVIPKNADNVENAHKFIDFICRPDIALKNFEYITYSTPNIGVISLEDDPEYLSPIVFPDDDVIERGEVYYYLGEEADALYNKFWIQLKSS